jgi:hypothetical protein
MKFRRLRVRLLAAADELDLVEDSDWPSLVTAGEDYHDIRPEVELILEQVLLPYLWMGHLFHGQLQLFFDPPGF